MGKAPNILATTLHSMPKVRKFAFLGLKTVLNLRKSVFTQVHVLIRRSDRCCSVPNEDSHPREDFLCHKYDSVYHHYSSRY